VKRRFALCVRGDVACVDAALCPKRVREEAPFMHSDTPSDTEQVTNVVK